MQVSWDIGLVILSLVVAVTGSFTAFGHAQRMRENSGRSAMWWMLVGGITLGATVWSMHFIGMLAFHLPIPLYYDLGLTLLSVLVAIAAALFSFHILRERTISRSRLLVSGVLVGSGISAMHYLGMAALRMSPPIGYTPAIVMLSVLIAILAAWGALLLMYKGERIATTPLLRMSLAGLVMGGAITAMHYTAMQGLYIQPDSVCQAGGIVLEPRWLALLIALTVLFWFGIGILATLFDERLARQNQQALDVLGKAHAELQGRAEKQAEAMTHSLRESEERFRLTIDKALDAIISIDERDVIIGWNSMAEQIFGYSAQEAVGQTLVELVIPQHYRERHRAGMRRFLETGESIIQGRRIEISALRKGGEEFPIELSIVSIASKEGISFSAFLRDISARKRDEQQIHHLAFYDSLTDLPNRRMLMERLKQSLIAGVRSGRYGAVLFLDMDNFKTLNDIRGHDIGDLLLVEAAKRITSCVRDGDTVARIGGDEFVVLLESLDVITTEAAAQAELVAEKIRATLNERYQLADHSYHSSSSIGIALFCGQEDTPDNLLKYADIAMYQAKTAGRNAIRFYDPQMQAAIEARADLEEEMRQALAREQFRLYYQIQMDSLGRPLGAEALLRWQHPERGMVSPAQFIPLAEESGLIVPVGLWVLQTACAQLAAWQEQALTSDLSLAVNVSARQFRQPDFVAQVQRTLLESGAKPSLLKLELTESTVLENVEDTIAKMRELKLMGLSFSMDDFGTGYSSLQYLKRLPLDQIKIDQSFVRDIATDLNDAAIVQTIIAMTRALGLNVIAEGVETEAQRDFLERHGCHAFQGYFFGKPAPLEQFEAQLNSAAP